MIAPWPPRNTGGAFYSERLYSELANDLEITVLADRGESSPDTKSSREGSLSVIRTWRPGHLAPFEALLGALRTSAHIYHIQFEYRMFGSFFATFMLPFIIACLRLFTFKPVVLTLHGIPAPNFRLLDRGNTSFHMLKHRPLAALFEKSLQLFYRFICLLSSSIIVHTAAMATVLAKYGVPTNKIHEIPHGVQVQVRLQEKKGRSNTVQSSSSSNEIILFLGFIRPSKGIEDLIAAIHILSKKGLKLTIAGGVPYQDSGIFVEKMHRLVSAKKLDGSVYFTNNFLPYEEMMKTIELASVIVLPYTDQNYETSGILAEVMAIGRPLICTEVPRFTSELEDRKDCLMVPPSDARALAKAISEVLKDSRLAQRIASNLKKKGMTRTWKEIALKHSSLFKIILER